MPLRAVGEMEVQVHTFLTSALDGGEWSASCSSCFIPRERTPALTGEGAGWVSESVLTQ